MISLKLFFALGAFSCPTSFFISKYETAKRKREATVNLSKLVKEGEDTAKKFLLLKVRGKQTHKQLVEGEVKLVELNNKQTILKTDEGRRTGLKKITKGNKDCLKLKGENYWSDFENGDSSYYLLDPRFIKIQGTKVKTKDNKSLNWSNLSSLPFSFEVVK